MSTNTSEAVPIRAIFEELRSVRRQEPHPALRHRTPDYIPLSQAAYDVAMARGWTKMGVTHPAVSHVGAMMLRATKTLMEEEP